MKDSIDFLICNYNGGNLLRRCIDSILNLNIQNLDIYIYDNASIDNSLESIKNYKLNQIKIVEGENNIGYGTSIGDHTYFASQVVISGNCVIGRRCFFGVNATSKDFTNIGDDVFVAMDASVTQDLPDKSVVLGAKSTVFDSDNATGSKIRNSYFKIDN